jgi:hypothetical protein
LVDQESCRVGDIVATATIIEIVVTVEVAAASLVIAEPQIERCGARIVIGDTEPDLAVTALAGPGFGGADDGCPDAVGLPFSGLDLQAVQLGAPGEALGHLRGGASLPQDLARSHGDTVYPRDQVGAQALLLTLEPPGVSPGPAGPRPAGFQQPEIFFPALPDVHCRGPSEHGVFRGRWVL